ncbi:MAG: hypothetical protein L6V93_10140 [Clostridiales bacterium]|nr:MAG: hypothetical protein L6V93_10140 [Clostridiales bacterium]
MQKSGITAIKSENTYVSGISPPISGIKRKFIPKTVFAERCKLNRQKQAYKISLAHKYRKIP